jgi:hypothetical protein
MRRFYIDSLPHYFNTTAFSAQRRPLQWYIDGYMEDPVPITLDGKVTMIPRQTEKDAERCLIHTELRSENALAPPIYTSPVKPRPEDARPILTEIKKFAGDDQNLFLVLATLACQTPKQYLANELIAFLQSQLLFPSSYHILPASVKQTFSRTSADAIEMIVESEYRVSEGQNPDVLKTFPHRVSIQIVNEGGRWICRNPVTLD